MKKKTVAEKRAYLAENIVVVLPKMESIKSNLEKVAPYGSRELEAYKKVCKSVDDDVLTLRGIDQYASIDFRVKALDEILGKVPSYVMELGKFQSLYSKKK